MYSPLSGKINENGLNTETQTTKNCTSAATSRIYRGPNAFSATGLISTQVISPIPPNLQLLPRSKVNSRQSLTPK